MRKIEEVLRLKWGHRLSNRQIAKSCLISHTTVREYLDRARVAGLSWPLDPALDNTTLESMLFTEKVTLPSDQRCMPSMDYLFRELKRKGVTRQLLWYEYRQANPDGYQYSQFCHRYRQWVKKLDVTLRQEHRAGEKLFIDYAGQTVPIIDPGTGECLEAQIFIAALGASSYTFAEGSLAQDLPSWIASHVHAFQFFGGVSQILVPDNLKAGVTHPHRYEPDTLRSSTALVDGRATHKAFEGSIPLPEHFIIPGRRIRFDHFGLSFSFSDSFPKQRSEILRLPLALLFVFLRQSFCCIRFRRLRTCVPCLRFRTEVRYSPGAAQSIGLLR